MTSRAELVAWVNDLLQLNYTKIEQLVVGPLMPKSSIQFTSEPTNFIFFFLFRMVKITEDVPLSRVKMNANQEYEYLNNFKVIQAAFKKHQIDKPVPVTALIKCKMQDNLEFLQWLKKYWDMHYPGGNYDAMARRKGAPADPNPLIAAPAPPKTSSNGAAGRTGKTLGMSTGMGAARATSRTGGTAGSQKEIENLTTQLEEFKLSMEGLEKERDFYFNKLRDIEILIGARVDSKDGNVSEVEMENLKQMQAIYTQQRLIDHSFVFTQEGFEVPELDAGLVDEEETF
ncbi:hypothetical protein PSTT_06672 [Puccinia striiformis]|uniref:EB1 C-terminal domain-containing protein n=1 Tax=Puccinia striiformis TaxID=27350 RepID=A0A2S4VJB0_9BASI|nr:hypothetical protein PSTT_06672 [Puccinia striiformis]